MITNLGIKKFKCFEDLNLSFSPLTLLTGFNGGGKSTSTQPLLLLAQANYNNGSLESIPLNGSFVRLGTASDVFKDNETGIDLTVQIDERFFELRLTGHAGERALSCQQLNGFTTTENALNIPQFELSYLSAVRDSGEDSFPLPDNKLSSVNLGYNGCYASYWYNQLADTEVSISVVHPGEPSRLFRIQLNAYLNDLFPGAQANVQFAPVVSRLSLQFRLSDFGEWRNPSNIGFGLTYCFPILVSLLAAKPGQVLIFDSPEAHLHPSAQSKMGEILARFAASGIQIIVETHSDHLLNGTRLAIVNEVIGSEDVEIHFFSGVQKGEHGVISLAINSDGQISNWPDGFFDQSDKDMNELVGWD